MQLLFNRMEQKYKINREQYEKILKLLPENVKRDKYGVYTICNIYYDTEQNEIISHSIEKPIYKEKIRIRSYKKTPGLDTLVFLEIKKKYKGIVNKRRIQLPLKEAYKYIENNIQPNETSQTIKEINNFLQRYKINKKIYIAYDREAFYDENDFNFRLTFDSRIRSRGYDVRLENGDYGEELLKENEYIMELKENRAIPLWFVKILSQLKIYPTSFSKYGEIYKKNYNKQVVNNIGA